MRTTLTLVALLAFAPVALGQAAKSDQHYFQEMAQGNLAEVQASKLAEDRAQADEVRSFARQMIDDHGRMLDEQRKLAKAQGLEMPKQPGKDHQAAMKKLQTAKGAEFDRLYMEQMVEDHEKSLSLVREVAKNAKDPQLRALAEKAEPTIQHHLQMARQIEGAAAGGPVKQK